MKCTAAIDSILIHTELLFFLFSPLFRGGRSWIASLWWCKTVHANARSGETTCFRGETTRSMLQDSNWYQLFGLYSSVHWLAYRHEQ
jgi:hypothetical protein